MLSLSQFVSSEVASELFPLKHLSILLNDLSSLIFPLN